MIAFFLPEKKQYLDISDDTKITVTMTTPLTDPDHVSRVYTFEFTAPRNAHNDALLQHAYRIDSRFSAQGMRCECVIGTLFAAGTLSLTDAAQGGYRLNFKSDERNILDELDYDLSTFAQETVHLIDSNVQIPFYNEYNFDILAEISTDPDGNFAETEIRILTSMGPILGLWNGLHLARKTDALQEMVDQFNLMANREVAYIVPNQQGGTLRIKIPVDPITGKELFQFDYIGFSQVQFLGFSTFFRFMNAKIVEKIDIINRDAASDFCFPTIFAPDFMDASNVEYFRSINNVDSVGNMLGNPLSTLSGNCINSYVPMLKVRYVLKKIAKRLNLTLGGDWYNEPDAQKLIIFNAKTIDKFGEINLYDGTGKKNVPHFCNFTNHTFTPGNHLPKITARAFLQQICHDLGIYIEVKNGMILLNRKLDLLRMMSKNMTKSIIANTINFAPRLDEGLKIAYIFDEKTIVPNGQLTATIINGSAKVQKNYILECGTLPMTTESEFFGSSRKTPHFFGKANDDGTALLFYRGVQQNARSAVFYPYATHDDTRHDGTVLGAWSLNPSGPKGLYNLHLKGIAELTVANEGEAVIGGETADITIREQHYGRIFAYTPNGHFEGIPKQIRLRFAKRGLDSVTMNFLVL